MQCSCCFDHGVTNRRRSHHCESPIALQSMTLNPLNPSGLLPSGVKTLANISTGQLPTLLEVLFSTKTSMKADLADSNNGYSYFLIFLSTMWPSWLRQADVGKMKKMRLKIISVAICKSNIWLTVQLTLIKPQIHGWLATLIEPLMWPGGPSSSFFLHALTEVIIKLDGVSYFTSLVQTECKYVRWLVINTQFPTTLFIMGKLNFEP